MISSTAKYALRAVVFLSGFDDSFVSRTEIADATLVPHDYLSKVLKALEEAGLVETRRGPGGGYCLVNSPEEISVLDVVLAVDTIPRIAECPLGISEHVKLCPLHKLLDDVGRKIEELLGETMIADLVPDRKLRSSCDFPKK